MKRIRINPTLRRNGLKMFPVKVEYTVSRDELVSIGTMRVLNEDALPATRGEWLATLVKCLEEYGRQVTPDYLTDQAYAPDEIKAAQRAAAERVAALFPDLEVRP